MTTYFTDAFTGSDGAAWNSTNWTTSNISSLNTSGSTATIQTNRGRLYTGTVASYGGKVARRYNGTNQADLEMSGKIIFNDAIDGRFECWIRASTSAIDGTGYILSFDVGSSSNVTIVRANSYSYTTIGTASVTINQGSEYNWKHYCVGNTHKAKVWTGSEPAYNINVSDSAVTAAGYCYVIAIGGGSSGFDCDIDDVSLTDGTGGAVGNFTGTLGTGLAGTFSRGTVTKNPFTGTLGTGLAGTLTKVKVAIATYTGTIGTGLAGTFKKNAVKPFTGTLTTGLAGTFAKVPLKSFAGTFSSSLAGFFQKSFVRTFTGTIASVGTPTITFIGRVFGRPGRVRISTQKAGEVRLRIRRG